MSITFTDNFTLIPASWLNNVNTVAYTNFGDGTSYTGILTIGPRTGWTTLEKLSFVDTAKHFFGARNLPSLGPTETNYFQFLGHDDNNTVANIVTAYSAMFDAHSAGTRASSVGFEGDLIHTGTGTTTGEAGVIGFSRVDAGIVGTSHGVHGEGSVIGGVVTDSAGVFGESIMTGGVATNTYAARFAGPNHSGGTVANNYGVYIGRVGSGGTVSNYQLYVEGSGAGNPVVVDNAGKMGIGQPIPINELDVIGKISASTSMITPLLTTSGAVNLGLGTNGTTQWAMLNTSGNLIPA